MNLSDLSIEGQELVLAFVEIARSECKNGTWDEVEPALTSCWDGLHRQGSKVEWHEIAPYMHSACDSVLHAPDD